MKNVITFILYILLPAAILVFLFWLGWGGGLGEKHDLAIKDIYSGSIGLISNRAGSLERSITVVNKSKSDVTIAKVYTDCKCLSVTVPVGKDVLGPFGVPTEENVKPLGINIGAGVEMEVKMIFNPADALNQNFSGTIFVETLSTGEILKIPISADIINQ